MASDKVALAREAARQWESAWRSEDKGRIASMLADDCVVWRNYEQVEHPKNAYLSRLDPSRANVRGLHYEQLRLLAHADGFIEQATLEGETAQGSLSAPFCRVVALKDGKIRRIDEYFDSATLEAAPE